MILAVEAWMDLRRYQPLREAGGTWREIADEVGLDWRTVKKYLSADAPAGLPAASSRRGTVTRKIDAVVSVIDVWLAADPRLKASVIHERLVAEHGFTGHYQRVKLYVAEARQRLAREADADGGGLSGLHRRFEVVAGAQAQVDWGDEGVILPEAGIAKVYSFHLTLSYSRDPFCCFTSSQDLGTFFDCHRRACAYFGGVPASIVYDRTKTVVRRHVAPREAVPLHPEAAVFAERSMGSSSTCSPRAGRPGRVGSPGRSRSCATTSWPAAASGRWPSWTGRSPPGCRSAAVSVTAPTASSSASAPRPDHAALRPLPALPYLVCERHLRRVGRDCLISFEGSHYSVPARAADGHPARAGQRVELRVCADTVTIHRLAVDGEAIVLAAHTRATRR